MFSREGYSETFLIRCYNVCVSTKAYVCLLSYTLINIHFPFDTKGFTRKELRLTVNKYTPHAYMYIHMYICISRYV